MIVDAAKSSVPSNSFTTKRTLILTVSQESRRRAMKALRWLKKHGPSHFNPHYQIKGASAQDSALSSRLGNTKYSRGPQFKTLQWEATVRVVNLSARAARSRAELTLSPPCSSPANAQKSPVTQTSVTRTVIITRDFA